MTTQAVLDAPSETTEVIREDQTTKALVEEALAPNLELPEEVTAYDLDGKSVGLMNSQITVVVEGLTGKKTLSGISGFKKIKGDCAEPCLGRDPNRLTVGGPFRAVIGDPHKVKGTFLGINEIRKCAVIVIRLPDGRRAWMDVCDTEVL
jgi:hypothetical protein